MNRKLTANEIVSYLSVNQNNRKRVMLHNIEDIAKVNDLLSKDDILTVISPEFYDAIHDYEYVFSDILEDFFLSHLDEEFNNNDVMSWLHDIYN